MNFKYLLVSFLLLSTIGIVAKEPDAKKLSIDVKEEGIFINEEKLAGTFKIEDYDKFFGKFDLKESREDGLYYTWDKLGIKLREDVASKSINQLSIYLTISRASDTKSPYKGKLKVISKEINSNSNPSKFNSDLICQQIFCTFKTEVVTVNTNLTEDKKKFKIFIIKLD